MSPDNVIAINNTSLKGNKIISEVKVPNKIKKYFHSLNFETTYDTEITCDESILNIPLVSSLLPVSWLTGVDISVDAIDNAYFEAVPRIRDDYATLYSRDSFKSNLIAEHRIDNNVPTPHGYALTFSGGVDSFYTMINNINRKPALIMIFGADMPLNKAGEINKVKTTYTDIAKEYGLKIHIITTNDRDCVNMWRITHTTISTS